MPAFVNNKLFKDMDDRLRRIAFIDRSAVLQRGFDEVGKIVKKQLRKNITSPGYPGDKTKSKPLIQAIRSKKLKNKAGIIVGSIYAKTSGGHHFRWVDWGHKIVLQSNKTPQKRKGTEGTPTRPQYPKRVGFVPGKFWLAKASHKTFGAQKAAVEKALNDALKRADKSGGTV